MAIAAASATGEGMSPVSSSSSSPKCRRRHYYHIGILLFVLVVFSNTQPAECVLCPYYPFTFTQQAFFTSCPDVCCDYSWLLSSSTNACCSSSPSVNVTLIIVIVVVVGVVFIAIVSILAGCYCYKRKRRFLTPVVILNPSTMRGVGVGGFGASVQPMPSAQMMQPFSMGGYSYNAFNGQKVATNTNTVDNSLNIDNA